MWFVQPKQDYIPEMPWKHADEPAVVSWQIRARNYNTYAANALFSVFFLVSLGGGYFMALVDESPLVSFFDRGGGCSHYLY